MELILSKFEKLCDPWCLGVFVAKENSHQGTKAQGNTKDLSLRILDGE